MTIDHTMQKFQSDLFSAGFWELSGEMRAGFYAATIDAVKVLVAAKRGKHADEKWQRTVISEHLSHAMEHAKYAIDAHCGDCLDEELNIDDDGLPHAAHAVARICCAYGREGLICSGKEREE